MIRYMGAKAIGAAVGLSAGTIRKWHTLQRRGERCPLNIRTTANGQLWCSASDVEAYFCGPQDAKAIESAWLKKIAREALEGVRL